MNTFFKSLFLRPRLFIVWGGLIAFFVSAYLFPLLIPLAKIATMVLAAFCFLDAALLYLGKGKVVGERLTPERFSNGDINLVKLKLKNEYNFPVQLEVIDEAPDQFQLRKLKFFSNLKSGGEDQVEYELRPVERGEYHFGGLHVFVSSPLGLLKRRFTFGQDQMVPTYPSYIQMRRFQFLAISQRLNDVGVKQIRRLGNSTEFEKIKEYVRGDDYRTINWKATARSGKLMVNQYIDERAQYVYCLIDKSRGMKMPFEGMSLLDYAINACLVLSNIALYRQDRSGLITFAEKIDACLPATNKMTQMNRIQEVLYNQKTQYLEADYERLYTFVKHKISQRSLLILFTNFETLTAVRRQLPYLQKIAKNHLLVVVFFENTELSGLLESNPKNTEEIYIKSIGENFAFEKQQIVRELERNGIISILSPPQSLTVNTINKYLEIKSRAMI
ncbi:MAG: DUF58 domain-containing protein [Bacteroidia bacterium]|nr:DUF58 domain-containing protein [Bacteroidia bacterium]